MLAELAAAEPAIQIELLASNALDNLLRREADIAVRMVRPLQASLVVRKLAELPIVAAAHADYLARAGTPRRPAELLQHRLIGYDRDETIVRGFAALGRHRLRRGLQHRPLARRAAAAADAEDPAAAVLAGGASRDPRQPRRASRLRLPGRGDPTRAGALNHKRPALQGRRQASAAIWRKAFSNTSGGWPPWIR